MGAFLTSLGSVLNQAGTATSEAREEKLARQQKAQQLDAQQAYLQIARQAEDRQRQEFEYRKKSGDLIEFSDGRLWSVSQGKFIDPQRPDPMVSLQKFIATRDPAVRKDLEERARTYLEQFPNKPQDAIREVMRYADEAEKEQRHKTEHAADVAESEKFREQERQEREKDRRADRSQQQDFIREMFGRREAELTPAATKIIETTTPTLQQVDRLLGDIDRLGLANNNQAGYLLKDRLKYALGIASPEGTLANDIAGLSLGSVVEAGSAMQGTSRSLVALRKALVHTPNAWKDSPMLMRRKLVEIRQRLQDMVDDARRYGTKGAPSGMTAPDPSVDPLGVLPGVKP